MVLIKKLNRSTLIILVILLIGLILRLQNFSMLPYDGHPMRQTDTEYVAYNFAFKSHNFLLPQNGLIRPIENTKAYFFLELPVYEYLIGIFYMVFGSSIEVARIVNLGLFGISFLALLYFVKEFFKKEVAVWSVIFFAFAPGSIFFVGHAIHPDVFMTVTLLLALASYVKWSKSKNTIFFIISVAALGISVGTRPFVLICLPAILYLMLVLKAKLWEYPVMILGGLAPYGFWKLWQLKFPEASTDYESWVLRGREGLFNFNVLVNRLILKNVVGEIFGKVISFLGFTGIIWILLKRNPQTMFLLIWILMVPIYWLLVPAGNITHQYYSDAFLIPGIIIAGFGASQLMGFLKSRRVLWSVGLVVIVGLTIINGYRTSQYYFNDKIDSDLLAAVEIATNIPKDSKIIYLADNSVPISLFHRTGWMVNNTGIDVAPNAGAILGMKNLGAKYLVEPVGIASVSETEMEKVRSQVTQVYSSSLVTIYKF